MNITELLNNTTKPELYEKGTAFMWDDEHISRELLKIHLNPDIDLGSRKKETIKDTAEWIMSLIDDKKNILDLGCGPGLYTEIYAKNGHNVMGIDISPTSIDYAKQSAQKQALKINYINANYLKFDLPAETYDLITMIYTDLGVLTPHERNILLAKIFNALKPGGIFVFDLIKDTNLDKRVSPRTWDCANKGFWKDHPYLVLSDSYLYETDKVILYQHIVIDKDDSDIYRFWTHFFSEDDIKKMLSPFNFNKISFNDKILPQGNIFNGDNIIFTIAKKSDTKS